ncbi:MAG: DUF6115 domain-containing protein [Defluviitaleaceae bacterium]|nr:DUF6115 domain-containing protein [Defluviitaleaceae bacterium]
MDIILVILIIGFSAITMFSMGALLVLRRREKNHRDSIDIEKRIADLDTTLDASLSEINKMGTLVLKEIDEKYQAILFMYNLMQDKQKELTNEVWNNPNGNSESSDVVSEMVAQYIEAHSAKLQLIKDEATAVADDRDSRSHKEGSGESAPLPLIFTKRPAFSNPRHKQIWEMHEQGLNVPDIARELGMGQGEVKLILELAARAS